MNVILDNVIFSLQQSGGISVYWYHLAKQLLAQENVNVSYLNEGDCMNIFHDKISFENANFIKTKHYPYIGRYLNLNLKANNEKSIFHSSYYRVSKNPKHANITTVHDFTYEHFKSGIRLKVHNYQKKHAILKSDGIICISENTKRDLLKYIPKAAGKNIKVIPNGVDRIFTKLPKENFEGLVLLNWPKDLWQL